MQYAFRFNPFHRQTGSTLIISLIILIILMLLGVTAMTVSDTQYKLAGNLQFEDAALNNAEAAVTTAESWLSSATGGTANIRNAGFTTYDSAATAHLYPTGTAPAPLTLDWSDSNSVQVGDNSRRYFIELVSVNSRLLGSSQAIGGRSSAGCNQTNTYLINARGTSARGTTKFIQSYFSVLSC
ncbi:pilus assembly PilX family protein [Ferrigenium kumadai]|nr:PilX N-terminal domain-containing pilus assembly protein [Ferrigenium kumadai]